MSDGMDAKSLLANDSQLSSVDTSKYNRVASDEEIEAARQGLESKSVKVTVVADRAAALEALKAAIPKGASVNNASSRSLIEVGFVEHLKVQTEWDNVHAKILAESDPAKQAELRRVAGSTPDYFVTSVSAIAQTGEIITGDLTGTRVSGFFGAANVVVLVGANKIVKDEAAAFERQNSWSLPMESARVRIAFKVPASNLSNVVAIRGPNPFGAPHRIHVIICKEQLGF